jgi:predicted Zn-dependent protease
VFAAVNSGVPPARRPAAFPPDVFPPPPAENEEARRQEIQAALGNLKPLVVEETAQELKPFFSALGAALKAGVGEQILVHYDVDRAGDEFLAAAPAAFPNENTRRAFLTGVRAGMGPALANQAQLLQWTATEIRNVKKLNDREVVVIVRHSHPNGDLLKMRWWLTRRSGSWKIYDFENLDIGLRMSFLVGTMLGQGIGNAAALTQATTALRDALLAAGREDADAAEQKLREIGAVQLPRALEALRRMVEGLVHLQRAQFKEALAALERASALQPDMPLLDILKGIVLNKLGRWEEALRRLEAYRELLGEDALVCQNLGLALRGLSRFADAARAYRRSLDLNPADAESFSGLLHSLEYDAVMDDVGPRFAKVHQPQDHFEEFAVYAEQRRLFELVEQLALAMQKLDPRYAPADFYLARVKAQGGDAGPAVALFKAALAKQRDQGLRLEYDKGFLQSMAAAGKYVAAYEAASDPRSAFRILAGDVRKVYRLDEMQDLIDAHRKKDADDPLTPYYQAALYVREGRYARADRAFTAALTRSVDAETLQTFRDSRVQARYYTGQALAAYREIAPRQEVFLQLAALCMRHQDDVQLLAVLSEHARNEPNSVDLLRYRSRLKFLQNDPAEGIALFQVILDRKLDEGTQKRITADFLSDAVKAGKSLDAYQAAPNAEHAFQVLGQSLFNAERFDDLRRLIEVHAAKHAADPWLAYHRGELLREKQAWTEAARAFAAGLEAAAEKDRQTFQSRLLLVQHLAGRTLQAYAESAAPGVAFSHLANYLARDKKGTELAALVQAHRGRGGDETSLYLNEARAQVFLKQPAAAAACLQKALEKQTNQHQRRSYVQAFVRDMAEMEQGLEGYRLAPDKDAAFESLAHQLVFEKKVAELEKLLEEHGQGREGNAVLQFYLGELHLLRSDAVQAGRYFAVALAKGSLQDRWRFRNGLFRARVKAGKAARAYQENEPGRDTFGSLAYICAQEKDAQQLQDLIDAHRRVRPNDWRLPSWDLEVRWLKKDYEELLKLLDVQQADGVGGSAIQWKQNEYRVRSLVKLERTKEAVQAAREIKRRGGGGLLLTLALASAGEAGEVVAALEKEPPALYYLKSLYQDADLGPLLRSEPFRAFREKFPEPRDKPGADLIDDDH